MDGIVVIWFKGKKKDVEIPFYIAGSPNRPAIKQARVDPLTSTQSTKVLTTSGW
jgi:hypothetical protein